MTDPSLHELERDVEATRARLARNLRTLRSPTAHAEFTEAVKQDAFAAKDELVERTRSAAQDRINDWVDAVKARAAENPAAVLAIAAGIGWRMIRNPPIATALIGVGLFSLLRGNAPPATGRSNEEYVDRAKARLRQQSDELAAGIAEQANAVAAAAMQKAEQWSEQGQTALREGTAQAADKIQQWREQAQAALRTGTDKLEDWSGEARDALRQGSAQAADTAVATAAAASNRLDAAWRESRYSTTQAVRRAADTASELQARASSPDVTDRLLLGAAGAAVAAALGVALQRRIAETEPAD